MKTLDELIAAVIALSPKLRDFQQPLCDAAKRYIHERLNRIKGISDDEREQLADWSKTNPCHEIKVDECAYLLFSDGSLYFSSNGESETWADANDFAQSRLDSYSGALDPIDLKLLRFLGDDYSETIAYREELCPDCGSELVDGRCGDKHCSI